MDQPNGHPELLVRIISSLRGMIRPDGGCPYYRGREPFCEPTALSLLALKAAGVPKAEVEPSLSWLMTARNGDGSIGLSPEHKAQGTWLTAQAAVAFHHHGVSEPLRQAEDWLIKTQSAPVAQDRNVAQDNSLIGWPWVRGTFGWVEPSAWALIALNLVGRAEHARAVEGRKLLLDREIPAGGWNYGNPEVRGRELLAFVDTTSLALIALSGRVPGEPITRSVDFLKLSAETVESPYDLAWAMIALGACRANASRAESRLITILDAVPPEDMNAVHLSMAAIALSGSKVLIQ